MIPLDGFSNWSRLLHVGWIFKNAFGEPVNCYVILDRDYYTSDEIDNVIGQLKDKGVKIHIWSKKEIENYLIDFDALYRLFSLKISKKFKGEGLGLSNAEFIEK